MSVGVRACTSVYVLCFVKKWIILISKRDVMTGSARPPGPLPWPLSDRDYYWTGKQNTQRMVGWSRMRTWSSPDLAIWMDPCTEFLSPAAATTLCRGPPSVIIARAHNLVYVPSWLSLWHAWCISIHRRPWAVHWFFFLPTMTWPDSSRLPQ